MQFSKEYSWFCCPLFLIIKKKKKKEEEEEEVLLLIYINYKIYSICDPRQFLFTQHSPGKQKVSHPCAKVFSGVYRHLQLCVSGT